MQSILILVTHLIIARVDCHMNNEDKEIPVFIEEPPTSVDFLNTTGAVIACSAKSLNGPLKVNWLTKDGFPVSSDISGLRHVRSDGSLVLSAFQPQLYLPDIHSNIYKCLASNHLGTIASRETHVRAVLKQDYMPEVYDQFVIEGNSAIFKCEVPNYIKDFVTVTNWIKEPNIVIEQTSLNQFIDKLKQNDRYLMLRTGQLLIRNVRMSDSHHKFRCETKHKLSAETVISKTAAKIIVTESYSEVGPRITHMSPNTVVTEGESAQLVCIGQGWPQVTYEWYSLDHDIPQPLRYRHNHRIHQQLGLITFQRTIRSDSGKYFCHINSSAGKERAEVELLVREPLSARIVPQLETVRIGQTITFNCTTSGFPIVSIAWLKDAKIVTDNSRIRIESNGHLIHIKNARRQDAAIYQCLVKGLNHDNVQASAVLIHGDDPPKFLEVFSAKQLNSGESVSLKCMATGTPLPMITWLLDDIAIGELSGIRQGDYVTKDSSVISFVNISAVSPEHGGEWTCVARSEVADIRHSAILSVSGSPYVRVMPNMTLVAHETLRLKCPVGGSVEEISWEKNGILLPFNHRQVLHQNGTLIIRDLSREADEGKYTCIARNRAELSKGSLFITVRVKPVIEPFAVPLVQSGQRLSITCTVARGDPPLTIKWLYDDQMIEEENDANSLIRVFHLTDYSSTLLFESVKRNHGGNYTCLAINNVGEDKHSAQMIIHEKPRWIIEPTDHNDLVEGNSVWIDCAATGSPQPKVIWKRSENISTEYKLIANSFHIQVLENGTLFIESVDKKDSGLYLCHVSNGIGSDLSKIIRVQIHVSARFRIKFRAETFERNERAVLICDAIGERPITVRWHRDKQLMNPEHSNRFTIKETVLNEGITSELVIQSIDRSDSALYQCVTSNAYGKDETSIQVIVQEPPDTPIDVKLSDIKSRSVRISWSPPFSGNSRLIKYQIYLKEYPSEMPEQKRNITIPATETLWTISDLLPLTNYSVSVSAVNSLGMSDPSIAITFQTEEEVPSDPPTHIKAYATSSSTIRISWKAPDNQLNFGSIKGYYIGYKARKLSDIYIYKTLEMTNKMKSETELKNLNRLTKYDIVVQAFNTKGAGPPSEPIQVETLLEDPPLAPKLSATAITSSRIKIEWKRDREDNNSITGYIINWWSAPNLKKEVKYGADRTNCTFENLVCGTRYDFSIIACNTVGCSEKSDISVTTKGSSPTPPDKESLLAAINSTFVIINLSAFKDNGCALQHFDLKYRRKDEKIWTPISNWVQSSQKTLLIDGLHPHSWYYIEITAYSQAGSSEAQYSFLTLMVEQTNPSVSPIPDTVIYSDSETPILLELEVILPLTLSVIVVVAVTLLVCVVIHKRQPNNTFYNSNSSCMSNVHKGHAHNGSDNVDLSQMDKSSCKPITTVQQRQQTTCIYYPTPYATTHIDESLEVEQNCVDIRQVVDDGQYATVKRTARLPKTDLHIYNYPTDFHYFNSSDDLTI